MASIVLFACSTKADRPSATPGQEAAVKVAKIEGASTAKATKKAVPKPKAPPPAQAPKAKQAFAEAPYKIRFVTKPAAPGKESATTIEITPLDGYKMNKDFPTSLNVDGTAGAATPKLKFATGDAEITEQRVGFTVGFTPKNAGALAMTGTTNFSVCNERTCKLFRGEKLAWEVSVK